MAHWLCWHDWGFPRRWIEFRGQTNVDVQTCAKCGARRVARVQFGREEAEERCPPLSALHTEVRS
jgi:hypothetical protein